MRTLFAGCRDGPSDAFAHAEWCMRAKASQQLVRLGDGMMNRREVQRAVRLDQRDVDASCLAPWTSSAATPRRRASRSRSASPNAREA